MICLTCGLRWGEAKALTKENIRSGKVFIFNTKSGKNRFVPIRDD
jgi:integrase